AAVVREQHEVLTPHEECGLIAELGPEPERALEVGLPLIQPPLLYECSSQEVGRSGERGHSACEELAAIAVIGRRPVEKLRRDALRLAQVAAHDVGKYEPGADGVGERVVPELLAQAHDLAEVLADLGDPPL